MFCFRAYGLVSPTYIYKYYNIIFSHNKGNFKKAIYVLACILALITSLFKPWELGQYSKNSKKSFCPLLVYGITNLYVKRIPEIKNMFFFT